LGAGAGEGHQLDWLDSAIWWHCYPLPFVGVEARAEDRPEGEPNHRLRRLANWFDYLIELGCNGLMLGPVFASTSHGYDTLDYFRVDPREFSYLKPKRVLSPSSSVMSGDGRVPPNLSNHSWICGISAAHSSVET